MKGIVQEIKSLIKTDQLFKAVGKMITFLESYFENKSDQIKITIILSRKLHSIQREYQQGTLDYERMDMERDKVAIRLLNILDKVDRNLYESQ